MLKRISWTILGMMAVGGVLAGEGRYLDPDQFLTAAFAERAPEQSILWVDRSLREMIERTVQHRFSLLRVRYWRADATTAWILDEVGKEQPITIGISVSDGKVESVRILEFREVRGWEVRLPFFTDQFNGAGLDSQSSIDRKIDGISGATLSVAAVGRAVKLALLLDEHVQQTADSASGAEKIY